MGLKPAVYEDAMYQLIRDGNIKEFNERKSKGEACDLTGCDFRHLDLRGLDASGIDFTNSYFRGADLRGIDFTRSSLEGASINDAKISGAYFPHQLMPDEITLSLLHGTRMRYLNGR